MEKLHMKLSVLNVEFDGPSLDVLGLRKPAHKGIKQGYPRESSYFTVVGQSLVKTVADRHEHDITTSISDELISRINIDGFERP